MTKERVDEITDLAERYIREGGFRGFSFRDIAKEIGIKSSSVHYHFPTKTDLAVKVARRYTERFLACLGNPCDPAYSPNELIKKYIALFNQSFTEDKKMCLCGVLAAESTDLPEEVNRGTRCRVHRFT